VEERKHHHIGGCWCGVNHNEEDAKNAKERRRQEVFNKVLWWIEDMAFKPPEVTGDHYYRTMAKDIANIAVGDEPVSHERLG
jgi:hypothetical protein